MMFGISRISECGKVPFNFLLKSYFERFLDVRGISFQIVVPVLENEFR